jgi:hypothetical protein
MRKASILISSALRRRHAMTTFQATQDKRREDGFTFASRTVHVGGVGKEWVDEDKLKAWFERGGRVLSVVVRVREPETDMPNNSWALVAFEDNETMKRLMGLSIDADHPDDGPKKDLYGREAAILLPADAADKSEDSVTFVVRRIDPVKAMASVGSFGKIFQRCLQKMDEEEKRLRREAKARRQREQERQVRWRALAAPTRHHVRTNEQKRRSEDAAREIAEMELSNLHAKLDGTDPRHEEAAAAASAEVSLEQQRTEVVIAEFSDGWQYCCQWPPAGATVHNPCPTLADMQQQGRPYYFNVRSGESRWLPPPSLSELGKTRPRLTGDVRSRPRRQVMQTETGDDESRSEPATVNEPGSKAMASAVQTGQPRMFRANTRRSLHSPKLSGSSARNIYSNPPFQSKSRDWRSQWSLPSPPTSSSTEEIRRVLRSGGGRADAHQQLLPTASAAPPATARPASTGGTGGARTRRRVVSPTEQQQLIVAAQHEASALYDSATDPVAYMMQWQHQKYASGPKSRLFDCFVPRQQQQQQQQEEQHSLSNCHHGAKR